MTIKSKNRKIPGTIGIVIWSFFIYTLLKGFSEIYHKNPFAYVIFLLVFIGGLSGSIYATFRWDILQFNDDNFIFIEHPWDTPLPIYYKWIESITIINKKVYIEINLPKYPSIRKVIEKDKFDSYAWETVVLQFSELKEKMKNSA